MRDEPPGLVHDVGRRDRACAPNRPCVNTTCATSNQSEAKPVQRCQTASRSRPIARSSHAMRDISSTSTRTAYVPSSAVSCPAAVAAPPGPCAAASWPWRSHMPTVTTRADRARERDEPGLTHGARAARRGRDGCGRTAAVRGSTSRPPTVPARLVSHCGRGKREARTVPADGLRHRNGLRRPQHASGRARSPAPRRPCVPAGSGTPHRRLEAGARRTSPRVPAVF